jgi:hypothetical protein
MGNTVFPPLYCGAIILFLFLSFSQRQCFCCVAQAGLELFVLLPQPPRC